MMGGLRGRGLPRQGLPSGASVAVAPWPGPPSMSVEPPQPRLATPMCPRCGHNMAIVASSAEAHSRPQP
eukprot:365611-Chlamydomonas_euryale.AAC.12